MNIFDKIASVFRIKEATVPLISSMNYGQSFFGMSNKAAGEYYRGWVFRCVSTIKDEVSKVEFVLKRKDKNGNEEVVFDHPALTLLQYVNEYFTKSTLFERLQADLELFGNHYWLIVKNNKGVPIEIYPLLATNIKAVADATSYVKYYEYSMDGKTYKIPAEDILHFKNYNPSSFICGVSTLEGARLAVDNDESAKMYSNQFFKNGAVPGVILEYPGTINAETQKLMRMQWDEQYAGFQKAYRTAVAAGGLKIHQMDVKQSDMQLIEQRRFSRDEIFAIFGVPPTIAGVNEATVYAAAKAAEYSFARFTIEPKLLRIVDTLNEFYLSYFPDSENLKLSHVSQVFDDVAEKTAFYTAGIANGFLSPNDIRRRENLPELEDGESVYLPLNLVAYSQPTAKKLNEKPAGKSEVAVKSFVSSFMKALKGEGNLFAGKWTSEQFDTIGETKAKKRDARTAKNEKLMQKTAQKLFEDQQKRVKAATTEEALKYFKETHDQNIFFHGLKFTMKDIFDVEKEIDITIDLFTPIFAMISEEEGKQALSDLGLDPSEFSIDTPTMQEFIKKNTKLFAGTINTTTSEEIRALIAEGLEAGEAIVDLRKRIDEYSGFGKARSEMIARTETIRAQGEAELAAWKESKVVTSVTWYTALDERVCPECGPMHGSEVATGEEFLSSTDLEKMNIAPYNGGITAPPLHPQCRCTLIPVVK